MQKLKFIKNCSNWLECENLFTYNIHLKSIKLTLLELNQSSLGQS